MLVEKQRRRAAFLCGAVVRSEGERHGCNSLFLRQIRWTSRHRFPDAAESRDCDVRPAELVDAGSAPGDSDVVSEAEKETIVRAVVDRLSVRFPEAPRPHIAGIVGEEYESLADGRIRSYIPTLIEHGARTRLHREFTLESSDNHS